MENKFYILIADRLKDLILLVCGDISEILTTQDDFLFGTVTFGTVYE